MVCGQAFHWFDVDRALPEIARVLKPRGRLSLVWNQRDERIPWVKRLGAIIGTQDQLRDPAEKLTGSRLFGDVEEASFKFWQVIDRNSIRDLVRSRSNVAVLGAAEQEAKMAEVLAFYDDFGRGMDGMQLPVRRQLLPRAGPRPRDADPHRQAVRGGRRRGGLGRLVDRHAAHRLPLTPRSRRSPSGYSRLPRALRRTIGAMNAR